MPDVQAQTPDGVIHSFPDGTAPEVVDGAIKRYLQSKAPKPTTADNAIEKARPSTLSRVGAEAAALPARVAGVNVEKDAGTNWLKNIFKSLTPDPEALGVAHAVSDTVRGMNDLSREGMTIAKTGRSVEPAAANEVGAFQTRPGGPVQKLGAEMEHPNAAAGVRFAASMVPVLGPMGVKTGHRIATGEQDTPSDVSDVVTAMGQSALLTEGGRTAAERAVSPAVKLTAALMRAGGRAVGKVAADTVGSFGVGVTGESMLKKGLAPYAKQTGYDAAVQKAGKDITRYHEENPIKSVRDLDEGLPKMQARLMEEEIRPVARKHATEELGLERMQRVSTAVHDSVSPFTEEFNEAGATQVRALAEKMAKSRTVGDIIGVESGDRGGLLGYINNHLESYFQKYPSARRANLMANPDTAGWEAARRQLREEVLGHLEEQGETGMRGARERWGAMEELRRATERRVNQAERTKPFSLPRIVGAASAVPTGGVSLILGEIAHQLNKPDVLVSRGVNRMMKAAKDGGKTIDVTPTRVSESANPL